MARPHRGLGPLTARPLAALLLGAALLAGCSAEPAPDSRVVQGESVAEPGAACTPPASTGTAVPADFPVPVALPDGGVLTSTGTTGGYRLATGRVDGSTVADVLAHFRDALPSAGQFVGRDEDEGRAGQLTFLGGASEGSVTVAVARCPHGAVDFTLSARRTR